MHILNKRLFILPCLVFLILSGCASDNTPKPEPMPKVTNEVALKQGWNQSAPASNFNPGRFTPTMFDGAVFVADSDGDIFKLDPSDGSIIQRYKVPREFDISSGVGVSGSSLFVTTKTGQLISIDKSSGKLNWQVSLPTISLETPQVARDIIVVRTNDAQLIAFNANTGATLWIYQRPIPSLTLRSLNTFSIIANEVIAAGLPGGKLALINLFSGTAIWENYIAIPSGATDLDKITDIAMRPIFKDKLICVATFNGKISCVDAMSSNILWQKPFSSSQGVVIDDQNVYAVSQDGVVYAFDSASGTQIWFNDSMKYRKLSAPALLGNGILAIDEDGYVHMFNRNDGHEMARISTGLKDGVSLPLVTDSGVLYQSANGNIAQIKNY